ncbi:hypothetical protein ACIGO8_26145 [Streptomyces sp. NPDC053493]|uniref:hypothetical protein n=1 Tax=Streptomyces sp. NPDC053493 TaxID=3365705 RepID=UPI0037D5CD37
MGDERAVRRAAEELALGRAVMHGFAHCHAVTTRPDRPEAAAAGAGVAGRGGGVTTVSSGIAALFDWTRLPAELPRRQVWSLMEELYELGPFGFRGPASDRVPERLTAGRDGVRTVRVLAPGRHCPSNAFLGAALELTGADCLFVAPLVTPLVAPPGTLPTTSLAASTLTQLASPPVTQTASPPVTLPAAPARMPLAGPPALDPDVHVLAPDDEGGAAGRAARYPHHTAAAPSVLAFHRPAGRGRSGLPALTLERSGSLSADHIRSVAANHGFALAVAAAPAPRAYAPSAAAASPVRR